MKICIYRQEEGQKFYITFTLDDGKDVSGFAITLGLDDIKKLNDMISSELQDLDKSNFKEEIVWNPRSQRHEKVKK